MKAAFNGALEGAKGRHREAMYMTWHGAAFQRSKEMPPLARALGDTPKAQTPEEMLALMQSLVKKDNS